jgi:hypothetical protein
MVVGFTKTCLILAALVLGVAACKEKTAEYIPPHPQTIRMPVMNQEVNLPSRLWEEIAAVYKPLIFDKSATEGGEDTKARLESPTEFFTFHVYLKEKTPGLFKNPDGYDLVYGHTGGLLDFQEFLQDRRGSFYLGFQPELKVERDDDFKVFFLSNSRHSEIGGETHGAGCGKYLDISKYFRKKMTGEGLFLNTTEGRHASLLSGTYFFATSLKGKLYISQLTVRDSRFKKLLCSAK